VVLAGLGVDWKGGVDEDALEVRRCPLSGQSRGATGVALAPGLVGKERPPTPSHRTYDPFVLGATPRLQLVSPKISSSDSPAQLRR
jgi:hypothetical protein